MAARWAALDAECRRGTPWVTPRAPAAIAGF